jgi:N-acetylmuramoyl-L-alanine amidase
MVRRCNFITNSETLHGSVLVFVTFLNFASLPAGDKISGHHDISEVGPTLTEQPDIPSGDVPEVIPTEHIAPESPAIVPDAPPEIDPGDALSAARTFPADKRTPEPIAASDAPAFIDAPVASARPSTGAKAAQHPRQPQPAKKSQRVAKQERFTLVTVVSALRSLIVTFAAAVIVATIFMWWTSPDFLSAKLAKGLAPIRATAERIIASATPLPTPIWFNRIGVLAGHSGIATYGKTKGNVDPGTVCPDGFTEAAVTMNVAKQVVATLRGKGFTVDMLEEYDVKLDGYQAAAFISLHADSCENFNDGFDHSGFKVTFPTDRYTARDRDEQLNECVRQNYGGVTGLPFTPGSITIDMTDYHAFHKVAPTTPAVILELGFLSYDRNLLENHTDKMALGVVNGILCFLQPKTLPTSVAPTTGPSVVSTATRTGEPTQKP